MNIILGAGLTGLSIAYHLNDENLLIFEREKKAGGLCRSILKSGFAFDYGGHFLHIKSDYCLNLLEKLNVNLKKHTRKSTIYFEGLYIPYPFQFHIYHLPIEKKFDCLMGIIKARCESPRKKPQNFKQWILQKLGNGIARHFMFPYNLKLWRTNLDKITTEWTEKFVPEPKLDDVVLGALCGEKKQDVGYNSEFFYPEKNGIEEIIKGFLRPLKHKISYSMKPERIDYKGKKIYFNGKDYDYERLFSTIPLPELIGLLSELPPSPDLKTAMECLDWISIKVFCFTIPSENLPDYHWIYYPNPNISFHRINIFSNISENSSSTSYSAIGVEVSYNKSHPIQPGIIKTIIRDLVEVNFISSKDDILDLFELDIPYAYVIYDEYRRRHVSEILTFLERNDIFSLGRYGAWEYSTMEAALLTGKSVKDKI